MARISPEQTHVQLEISNKPQRVLDPIADEMVNKYGAIGNLPAPRKVGETMFIGNHRVNEFAVALTKINLEQKTSNFHIKSLITGEEKEITLGLETPYILRDDAVFLVDKIKKDEAFTHWLAPKTVRFRRGEQKPISVVG